jgi:hypothetical protein
MKRCIVSFADGAGDYKRKLKRLEQSLKDNTDADLLMFTDYKEINCEHHSVVPYKFKSYAIKKAIELGYSQIIWCDSPIIAIKPIHPLFDHIAQHGYAFFNNIGHSLGMWTNDKCLQYFGITRQEAMNINMIMACCMAFNVDHDITQKFLKDYIGLTDLYHGKWNDHRHDQSVASCLIYDLNMKILTGHKTFFCYAAHDGVRLETGEVIKFSDSVCLLSQ